jgi:hypothetical protein
MVFALDADYYVKDLDKIFYTVSLQKGQAAEWYEGIHILIHEDAAEAAGIKWDPNSEWRVWSHFRKALSGSFVSSLTREKAVVE